MSWYLERENAPSSRVLFEVLGGETELPSEQPTGVFHSIDGNVMVWQSPAGPPGIVIPDCALFSDVEVERLRALVTSGVRLTLCDDRGTLRPVRCINGFRPRLLPTPDRIAKPQWRVKLEFVGLR